MHRYILAFFMACTSFLHAGAQRVLLIEDSSLSLIGEYLEVYVPDRELDFAEVLQARDAFVPAQSNTPNLGTEAHSIWLKLRIQNKHPRNTLNLFIANPTLDEVALYHQPGPGLPFKHQLLSKRLPLATRPYKGAEFVFPIAPPDAPTEYFIRIKSEQPLILPVSVNLPIDQLDALVRKNWLNGIYFGVVIIMALYNFFLYTSVRDSSYLYYVVFICTAGITQLALKGIAFQYFWPGAPAMEVYGMLLSACISGIAALLFTRKFLNLPAGYPWLNKLVWLAVLPFLVSLLLILFNDDTTTAFLWMRNATTLASLLILGIAIYAYIKDRTTSVFYFLLGWSVLIVGSIIYLLYNYGILPYSITTTYSFQLSSAIEMTLFSFALASRIKILQKEKEYSRRTALRLARENERIVKSQNVLLERKVAKRTEELVQKNEELNATFEDLKQAQSKLVVAEKMSSLGQLTAGIAHEINNPINFVSSNIKPLKRDFDALLDALEKIEHISLTESDDASRKAKIAALKNEQDLDYLKVEIAALLKGVQEGAGRTADIVKGLRIFSRIDEADLKTADLNEGLQSTLVVVSNLTRGIEISTSYGDIPQILCYPGKLNQVFLNIISNAIGAIREKFGDTEGGKLSISSYYEKEGIVCIAIKDNGIGMDEATRSKIYEPFFTTKKVGEGMGLGMSIVFSIIKEHNADIQLISEVNSGTEFVLKLPDMQTSIS